MLVLTRRTGEAIHVGDDIVVTVLEVGRDHVRIGIRAPRSVSVHREEVYQEILLANRAAADTEFGVAADGQGVDVVAPTSLPPRRRGSASSSAPSTW